MRQTLGSPVLAPSARERTELGVKHREGGEHGGGERKWWDRARWSDQPWSVQERGQSETTTQGQRDEM